MYGTSNMETYITINSVDSQQEFAIWLKKLKQELCINLEEWDGEGYGREVQKGGDMCISNDLAIAEISVVTLHSDNYLLSC